MYCYRPWWFVCRLVALQMAWNNARLVSRLPLGHWLEVGGVGMRATTEAALSSGRALSSTTTPRPHTRSSPSSSLAIPPRRTPHIASSSTAAVAGGHGGGGGGAGAQFAGSGTQLGGATSYLSTTTATATASSSAVPNPTRTPPRTAYNKVTNTGPNSSGGYAPSSSHMGVAYSQHHPGASPFAAAHTTQGSGGGGSGGGGGGGGGGGSSGSHVNPGGGSARSPQLMNPHHSVSSTRGHPHYTSADASSTASPAVRHGHAPTSGGPQAVSVMGQASIAMEPLHLQYGRVTTWQGSHGYILCDMTGESTFVHISDCPNRMALRVGTVVQFAQQYNPHAGKMKATHVTVVPRPSLHVTGEVVQRRGKAWVVAPAVALSSFPARATFYVHPKELRRSGHHASAPMAPMAVGASVMFIPGRFKSRSGARAGGSGDTSLVARDVYVTAPAHQTHHWGHR